MLKYKFKETEEIKRLLLELRALKIVFENLPSFPHIEENWRRESLLKNSLFSARIEGNPLTLEKVKTLSRERPEKETEKLEVFNLLSAYRYIYSQKSPKNLSLSFIHHLHSMVMKRISPEAGKLRQEPWGIFNQTGVVVYLAPTPLRLPKLMKEFVKLGRKLKWLAPIKAGILGFIFEKIHPFGDGNGRVGRLISAYILKTGGYDFRGLVSFEEIIERSRSRYYEVLEPSVDATAFVHFFLESLIIQARETLKKFQNVKRELPEDVLLPRRREILEIIKDHPYCSFNFLARRFSAVNPKTLHYDLKKLQGEEYILKVGKTRGATYRARK